MKKVLVKLISCIIPFKSLRKKFREYFIKNNHYDFILNVISKKFEFENQADKIINLAIGSSHCDYGFNPNYMNDISFNYAFTSFDLYNSYILYLLNYKKIKNLKNVLLFFSSFSNGFNLIKTNENFRCQIFKEVLNITEQEQFINPIEIKDLKKIINNINKKYKIINNYGYNEPNIFFKNDYPVKDRIETHLRENKRIPDQLMWVEKLQELCINNKHNLIIVIPPVREDYKNLMLEYNILFEKINNIKNLKILNFYNDTDFNFNDFGDFDHLNECGAKKLTIKINNKLAQLCQ